MKDTTPLNLILASITSVIMFLVFEFVLLFSDEFTALAIIITFAWVLLFSELLDIKRMIENKLPSKK